MGHISEAWTNLALSRRELHHKPSGGNCTVTAIIFWLYLLLRAPTDRSQQMHDGSTETSACTGIAFAQYSFDAAVSYLWRSAVDMPEADHGMGEHDAGYIYIMAGRLVT